MLLAAVADEAARVRREGGARATVALVELARVAVSMRAAFGVPPASLRSHVARSLARAWVLLREQGQEAAAAALEADAAAHEPADQAEDNS